MIDNFFIIILFLAVALLVTSLFKKNLALIYFVAFIFIFLGSGSLGGLSYISGSTIIEGTDNFTVNNVYSVWSDMFSIGLSWFLILFGVFLLIISSINLFTKKSVLEDMDED